MTFFCCFFVDSFSFLAEIGLFSVTAEAEEEVNN
jgi:hypothetical protein